MSFLNKLSARLPFGKKEEVLEYFFALNITTEKLTAALWALDKKELKILAVASDIYSSQDQVIEVTDKLLDQVVGIREIEPQKILFGVPNSWLSDDNLKDEHLKFLRKLVKDLELTPMAYVATGNALIHFLEKKEGVPTTAILVGFEQHRLTVIVVRAGKLDGVKVIGRGEVTGADIEKVLLTFTEVETLPSKILIYGLDTMDLEKLKSQLLSFSWMSKLSFLHFPKIDILEADFEIKSVCLAGGSEINSNIIYTSHSIKPVAVKQTLTFTEDSQDNKGNQIVNHPDDSEKLKGAEEVLEKDNLGFIVGDVSNQTRQEEETDVSGEESNFEPNNMLLETDDFEKEEIVPFKEEHKKKKLNLFFLPKKLFTNIIVLGLIAAVGVIIGAYLFIPKAKVKIFVEPKILENDAQVTADPAQKTINEDAKIIPGQIVETDISGSAKDNATGKRQIGDPSKGTVKIINNSSQEQNFSKGTAVSSQAGVKFTFDTAVKIASTSAFSDSKSTANVTVTAALIGADGNLPSGTQFTIVGNSSPQVAVVSEGNFSGGTSKEVTVVSSDDAQRLLAKLSSELRQQSQQKLQEKLPNKKILEEALSEQIVKKSYNKNINDQASEFSLNLTVHYKGTAFDDADLRTIVSKLVTTKVPDHFQLDLANTETQADVSKLEKDGKVIFLAKFKAKLLPKIDTDKIKNQIKFKTVDQVTDIIKGMDNILGSEITFVPNLPKIIQRLPILGKNITIEVGLK